MKLKKDLIGNKFGRWTVLGFERSDRHGLQWRCKCECGKEKVVLGTHLRYGNSRSCGCLKSELTADRSTTHGHTKNRFPSPEYNSYSGMMQRCYYTKHKRYCAYGGRGIRVCKRWRESFENFIADMGVKPSEAHSIERKNNDGHYEPSNCVWATKEEQGSNTRQNHLIQCGGKCQTLARWSRETGIGETTITRRLKLGWSAEDALGKLVRPMAWLGRDRKIAHS